MRRSSCLEAILAILVASAVFAPPARASRVSVLRCADSARLLDYFEGEALRGLRFEAETGGFEAEVSALLERVSARMPDRAELFRAYWRRFPAEAQWLEAPRFEPLPAEDRVLQPPASCAFSTVLGLGARGQPEIDRALWEALPYSHRAGAVLAWMFARERQESPGTRVADGRTLYLRVLNSLLPRGRLEPLGLSELIELLRSGGLRTLRVQGVLVDLDRELKVDPNGRLARGLALEGSTWAYGGQSARLRGQEVRFHPNGAVRAIRFQGELPVAVPGIGTVRFATPADFSKVPFEGERNPAFLLHDSGRVERGLTLRSERISYAEEAASPSLRLELQLAQNTGRFEAAPSSQLFFFPDGKLKLVTQASGRIRVGTREARLGRGSSVDFHRPGVLKELIIEDPLPFRVGGRIREFEGFLMFFEDGSLKCGYPSRTSEGQVCFQAKEAVVSP